jgi:hypothetical protein
VTGLTNRADISGYIDGVAHSGRFISHEPI